MFCIFGLTLTIMDGPLMFLVWKQPEIYSKSLKTGNYFEQKNYVLKIFYSIFYLLAAYETVT